MIAYAKQKGIKIASSTNGHLFAQTEHADKVIRSGLDTLIFAMDGISQETYETYRRGGRLETVLEGIKTVVSRKHALNSKTPLINLRFLVMKHNEHEIPKLKEMARSLGVDVLTLKTLNPCLDDNYGEKKGGGTKNESELLPAGDRFRRFGGGASDSELIRLPHNRCRNPWNSATIHWSGVVCPCTFDYNDKFVLGDLKEKTFKEIWSGLAYRRMRRRVKKSDPTDYFCYECSYAYQGGSLIDETVKEAIFFKKEHDPDDPIA
jgi:radical SAM protein with 4Fe4S-binding SPASM domain